AMSKSAVKISSDLLSNPLCEQEPAFLEMVTAFDTAMKRMDSFNQEKVDCLWLGNGSAGGVMESQNGGFSSVFPSLNMAVKRREQTLQDYKRLQSKVEKYEEKERTGPVLAKLHQ
ncbi:BIN3 protein, partial [Rhagologus leucostigma]|nr:BIN3 protein [Rhagologus leucostigma]